MVQGRGGFQTRPYNTSIEKMTENNLLGGFRAGKPLNMLVAKTP